MAKLDITHATVALDDIAEPDRNPNHMGGEEFEALCAVVREKGFLQPILLRRMHPLDSGPHEGPTWELIDGVHRRRAMLREGITSCQAVCTNATPEEARLLQVSMNKLRGELNLTVVAETVRELVEGGVSDETLRLIGYSDDDLRTMMEATKPTTEEEVLNESGGSFLDEEPEEDAKPKPYLLELTFKTAAELRKVKRILKKAGKGDHAAGLLSLIEGA